MALLILYLRYYILVALAQAFYATNLYGKYDAYG